MTTPDIDDWDQPVAAYTGPERRHRDPLDHTKRVWAVQHDGGYGITDGDNTVHAVNAEDAKHRAFIHNYCIDPNSVSIGDLRRGVDA